MANSKKKFRKQKRSFINLESLDSSDIVAYPDDDTTESIYSVNKSSNSQKEVHALFVLENAFKKVTAVGSSTAVVAVQNGNQLSVCNLGDSGFRVFRREHNTTYLAHRSEEQSHTFNTPF